MRRKRKMMSWGADEEVVEVETSKEWRKKEENSRKRMKKRR